MRASKSGAAVLVACGALGACASSSTHSDPPDAGPAAPIDAAPVTGGADARTTSRAFQLDTAQDFTADLPTLDDATIESWGAVAPIAWYTGGLLQRASDTGTISDAASTTWAQVIAMPSTGKTALQWATVIDWGGTIPPAVALTASDNWTIWDEGEIYLEAGSWTFQLLADDHGFVEVAPPRTATFTRVVSSDWPDEKTGTFVAAAAGWYPFHYCDSNGGGGSGIRLQLSGPSTALGPIARERLRTRADDVTGLAVAAFDDAHLVGDVHIALDATAAANADWMMSFPADLGITAADTFSLRWSGQLRIDNPGSYSFHYTSDDGQRLWIDGAPLLDAWDDTTHDATSAAVTLDPGWHDVVIDYSETGGSAAAHLAFASGPGLIGMAMTAAPLRPIEARKERIAPAANHADVSIPDLSTVQSTVAVTAPLGATIDGIDVSYEFNHGAWGDLVVSLKAPDGTLYVTRNRVDGTTSGDHVDRAWLPGLSGGAVAGTWTLLVQDAQSGSTGTLLDFEVTPHFAGGVAPIPTMAAAESIVHDLGPLVAIDHVSWVARVPAGAAIAVRVRTCADPAACASAPWSDPITTSGGAPAITAARYFQYRVELTSDGDHAPALESLKFEYRTSLAP